MIDLVCNLDLNYVEHCGTMLTSFFEKNTDQEFRIHLINREIGEGAKQRLNRLSEKYPVELIYYDVPYSSIRNFPIRTKDHLSVAAYLRLFMSVLLPDTLDKVLYLDCDLLVVDSIRGLWDMDLKEYAVAAVEERFPHNRERPQALGYPAEYSYFNSGVLLINLKRWREMDIYHKGIEFMETHFSQIRYHDQDILNALLYKETRFISIRWNLMDFFFYKEPGIPHERKNDLSRALKNPGIIHFTGSRKPWAHHCDSPFRDQYIRFAKVHQWNVIRQKDNIHYHCRKALYDFLYFFRLKKEN